MFSNFNTLIDLYKGVTQTPLLKKAIKLFSGDLCRVFFLSKTIWGLIHYLPAGISSKVKAVPAITQGGPCINSYLHHGCSQPCPNSASRSCWCYSAYWATLTPHWEVTIAFLDLCHRNRLREGDSPQQFAQLSLRFACCTWIHLCDIWQHLRHIPISCGWLMP